MGSDIMRFATRMITILSIVIVMSMNLPLEAVQSGSAENSSQSLFMPVEHAYPADGFNHSRIKFRN